MMQMGSVGPMLGQTHHFVRFNKGKSAYAEERYAKECARIYNVLDRQLGRREYLAGDVSIADLATWPWDFAFRVAGNGPRRLSECKALVSRHCRTRRRAARL